MSIKLIGDAVHNSDMEHYIAEKYKFGNDPINVGDVVEFLDFKTEGRYPNITYQPYIHTCKVIPHAQIEIPEEDQGYWGEGVKYYPRKEDEFEVKWEEWQERDGRSKTHTFLNAKKKYLRLPRNYRSPTLREIKEAQQKTHPDPVKQEERIADLEHRVLELEQKLVPPLTQEDEVYFGRKAQKALFDFCSQMSELKTQTTGSKLM